ncbi:bifunctional ADP-dependent NAD(P)H-hydrate dehydratase/NAD(P)H-hydrate epimerase [Limnohabitans sp. 63ED37-2]|uniref:bifunctional ADP-dependent NAD(P)H-hydrate dehydratase/NAD(P)H-hydrate epimerase n=1 Tax=Limnohabitans sp. 63ED37-2 TaxID=1678128 RepID=UPI00070576B5|nr:bifunctional ADP-dependent NAD(P)H-hydrate dehydratase/NAD(P)H-hydrate epimerase [Limnohabitans sp. 63ED37-2]ALK88767.1 Bifunctional NAD(P)H-hydrate repair enzyme Nnr [Limnohabitans sp. 63ED37-2]
MHTLSRSHAWPALGPSQVRQLEPALQTLSATPLMQSAGLACARLALAVAPHARRVWVAAGPGNNGGDGLEAALLLHQWGKEVVVSLVNSTGPGPADARAALQRAQEAGVRIQPDVPTEWLAQLDAQDLCIDALLGIGATRPLSADLRACVQAMQNGQAPVLAIDVPTGLNPQSGQWLGGDSGDAMAVHADHTLSLIAVQAGLLMGHGRDASGQIWLEDLGYRPSQHTVPALAWLNAPYTSAPKPHAIHKGSHGDVAVIGGEGMATNGMGMSGAAILAATAALNAGAGRVILSLLSGQANDYAPPDVMQREFKRLALEQLHVVCGCGGGTAVNALLPEVLQRSSGLVLDADGLNAVAQDSSMQNALRQRAAHSATQATVITPHPLEAARLLGCNTAQVQNDRLKAAQELAERFQCCVVLKGSGTVIAAPDQTPRINITGNGRLAIGGTGDVLAGLVGARMAQGPNTPEAAFDAACQAVAQHGQVADGWPPGQALTASRLAKRLA